MILYVIENSITPRIYVGVTARALCKRWAEHLKDARNGVDRALYRAMRKHGIENFSIRQIDTAASWPELCELESKTLLSFRKSQKYNMTTGGEGSPGHPVSEETREKIRAKHIGKKLSAEHREKLSAAKTGRKLPPRSAEHCARISAGLVRAHARKRP